MHQFDTISCCCGLYCSSGHKKFSNKTGNTFLLFYELAAPFKITGFGIKYSFPTFYGANQRYKQPDQNWSNPIFLSKYLELWSSVSIFGQLLFAERKKNQYFFFSFENRKTILLGSHLFLRKKKGHFISLIVWN